VRRGRAGTFWCASGAVLVAFGLTACGESNQDRSAKIAAQGKHAMQDAGLLKVARSNRDVKVGETALVRADGAVAAAVELDNRGSTAQVDVPVLIDVTDAKGASVYRNDANGLQPSLQRIAVVARGARAWWVNDQLLGAESGSKLQVRVGAAASTTSVPDVKVRDVHFEDNATGRYLTGVVVNHTGKVQTNLPVFAVAVRGGKVVAAGRSLVAKVAPGDPTKKPRFQVFFIGDPQGAKVHVTVAPNVKEAS
jgi:hypothetical protein